MHAAAVSVSYLGGWSRLLIDALSELRHSCAPEGPRKPHLHSTFRHIDTEKKENAEEWCDSQTGADQVIAGKGGKGGN